MEVLLDLVFHMHDQATKSDGIGLETAQLLQLVLDNIPQKVFWKDSDSVYMGCNQLFATDAGLRSPESIVGLTDFDLPWTDAEAEFYRACDRRVMESNQPEVGIVETQTTSEGELTWLETNKVPLLDGAGEVIGILGTYHDITKVKKAEQTLQRAHDHLEKCVEERTKQLRYIAQHDSLTNVASRRHFKSRLEEVIDQREPFALLFVDLDRFKPINDILGHNAGDQLLIQVSSILQSVSPNAFVGRFGGDEFTLLLQAVTNLPEVTDICEEILKSLREDIVIGDAPMVVTASIGLVVDTRGTYDSAHNVLRDADIAMYEAKRAGKARYQVCSESLLRHATERLALEKQIRDGIKNKEFFAVYQPVLDLGTGRIQSFEALLRWRTEECGVIGPDRFLSLAEETGLISDIGEQMILDVSAQLRRWRSQSMAIDLPVSVNLSAVQIRCPSLPDFLAATLATNGLQASDIGLEITESLLLEEVNDADGILRLLRGRGHKLMLDDFGTGYSSLSYVHRFCFDTLKIDKSFIHAIDTDRSSQAIVKTIVGLAKNLDLDVVAEGVETKSQEAWLRKLDCSQVQGYRYSHPMSAEQATVYLTTK